MSDVIVVGGGVIGLMSAWRLAQAGASVQLFERGQPGAEASAAALGVLTPQAADGRPDDFLQLTQASLALYPSLAADLRAQTDMDIELRDEGMLYVALDAGEVEALQEAQQTQQSAGVPTQWLSAREARALEPILDARIEGALFFTATRQVNNPLLCQALIVAATRVGVKIHTGQTVTRVLRDGYGITGIQVGATHHAAEWVVLAAGSWSGQIENVNLPVRPMKGQALALEAPVGSLASGIRHILDSSAGYVVPRRDGSLLIGATVEDVGYDKQNTVTGVQKLLADAVRFVPALKEAKIRSSWAGLRPCSADGLPLIGPVPDCAGFIAATGHYRNGILLAPITAQLVTEWVTNQPQSLRIERFAPDRFGYSVVSL